MTVSTPKPLVKEIDEIPPNVHKYTYLMGLRLEKLMDKYFQEVYAIDPKLGDTVAQASGFLQGISYHIKRGTYDHKEDL